MYVYMCRLMSHAWCLFPAPHLARDPKHPSLVAYDLARPVVVAGLAPLLSLLAQLVMVALPDW